MTEEWRAIPGFDWYEVSSLGRVRSLRRGLVMRPHAIRGGYLRISLFKNGEYTRKIVGRLVLEAFVGPCPDGMECRHVDDHDVANNALANLSWGTKKENAMDRDRHGRTARGARQGAYTKPERVLRGNRHGMSLVNEDQVRSMRVRHANGESQAVLAREYGVHLSTVHLIIKRKNWAHVGP